MIVRRARVKDIPQTAALGVEMLKYHLRFDKYFTPSRNARAGYAKFFKSSIFSRKRQLLVVEEAGKIVGYSLAMLSSRPAVFKLRKIGMITDVFIAKPFRRRGTARRILEEQYSWLRRKGFKVAELAVHSRNELGKRAWTKYGFDCFVEKRRRWI
ncbi:MAG: GNAT family N-acetyltransferase [Planctomycetota bacterium]|nr:GNAT family N-acetyltransferase [Planctomycetota bacterium]